MKNEQPPPAKCSSGTKTGSGFAPAGQNGRLLRGSLALPLFLLLSVAIVGLRRLTGVELANLHADPKPAFTPVSEQIIHALQSAVPWAVTSLFRTEVLVSFLFFGLALWLGYRSYPEFFSDYINAARVADLDACLYPREWRSRRGICKSLRAPRFPYVGTEVARLLRAVNTSSEDPQRVLRLCQEETEKARRALAKIASRNDDEFAARFYPDQFAALRENLELPAIHGSSLLYFDNLDPELKDCIRHYAKSEQREVHISSADVGSNDWHLKVIHDVKSIAAEFAGPVLVFLPALLRPMNIAIDLLMIHASIQSEGVTIGLVPDLTGLPAQTFRGLLPICEHALIGSSVALLTSEPVGVWWSARDSSERNSKWSIATTSSPSNLRSVVTLRAALDIADRYGAEFSLRSDLLCRRFRSNLGAGFTVLNNPRQMENRFYLTVTPDRGWKDESSSILASDDYRGVVWDSPNGTRYLALQFPFYLDYWSMSRKAHAVRELALSYFSRE